MTQFRSLKLRSNFVLAAWLLAASGLASALDERSQFHGSFTQGAVYSSDNNFYGPSDDNVSWKFTEINLNGSTRLLPNVRVAGQVMYRQAGAATEGADLDYGFIDYQFVANNSLAAGIELGRVKAPIDVYNETRGVAFTRPSIFLPQSAYPDIARNLELSADGVMFYATRFTDAGQWSLYLGAGDPRFSANAIESLFAFVPGKVSQVKSRPSAVGRLMFQSADGEWQATLSEINASAKYHQELQIANSIFPADIDLTLNYWIASLQYNWEAWTFTGEYGQLDTTLSPTVKALGPQPEQRLHSQTYYLQATRRLNQQWSVYGRCDNLYWDRHDPGGESFAKLTYGRPHYDNFANDYMLGVRYDLRDDMMISAEYHYIDGTAWLSLQENPNLKTTSSEYWNMVAVEFSYRF